MYQQPFQPQHFASFATHQQAPSLAGAPQNNGHYQANHHHQIPVHMQSHGNALMLDHGFEHAANGQLHQTAPQIQAANAAVVAMTAAAHHLHSQQAQQAMSHLQPPQPIFITTDVSFYFDFVIILLVKYIFFFQSRPSHIDLLHRTARRAIQMPRRSFARFGNWVTATQPAPSAAHPHARGVQVTTHQRPLAMQANSYSAGILLNFL